MTPPPDVSSAKETLPSPAPSALPLVQIPRYLEQVYWWAYVHPRAVHTFEREWLVNLILFGNYGRLRDSVLDELSGPDAMVRGKTLQLACVYGNLTPLLLKRLAEDASLDVLDILPIQLKNLAQKIPPDERVALLQGDSSSLACADASYDSALMFFLLHEQPERVRRATLAEAMRVVKPGGKIVIVDYHRPPVLHPLRLLMTGVFRRLEPYAMDLWRQEVEAFLPDGVRPATATKRTFFGGLYQKLVWIR